MPAFNIHRNLTTGGSELSFSAQFSFDRDTETIFEPVIFPQPHTHHSSQLDQYTSSFIIDLSFLHTAFPYRLLIIGTFQHTPPVVLHLNPGASIHGCSPLTRRRLYTPAGRPFICRSPYTVRHGSSSTLVPARGLELTPQCTSTPRTHV